MDIYTVYLGRKIENLKNRYDLILMDSAPGLSKETLSVMRAADELLVMTTSDITSIITSLKLVELAKKIKIPITGIALNMVQKKGYELHEKEISKSLEVHVIAKIPIDEKIPEAVAAKIPVVMYDPFSPASIAFKELAAHLIGRRYKPPGILSRMKSSFSKKHRRRVSEKQR